MSSQFDAGFDGQGFALFEHWKDGGESLLMVTSDRTSLPPLDPGDIIVKRTWAAAGEPEIYNQTKRKELPWPTTPTPRP